MLCGNKTVTGSCLKALKAIIAKGGALKTNAGKGTRSTSTSTTSEGTFSSSSTLSSQDIAELYPTLMKALEIYTDVGEADYRGTHFMADVIYDDTKNGATFGPTIGVVEYFQQMVTDSPLVKSDVGIKGGYEVMEPCRIAVNQIIRQVDQEVDQGTMKFDSVDWVHKRPEIIGKFAETTYQLKEWQTSWNIQDPVVPNEALVVVALAVGLATQGAGVTALSSLLESVNAATGMQLSAAGIAAFNAGFSAVCSRMATSTLATGDLAGMAKDLTSKDGIKSIGISMASAGLCQHIGSAFNINMEPGQKVFMDHLNEQLVRGTIDTVLNVTIGDVPINEALSSTLKQIPIRTVAAYVANKIGALYGARKLSYGTHKALHAGLGAATGFAIDPTVKGALSGASFACF